MMEKKVLEILKEIGNGDNFENSVDFIGDGLIDSFGVIALVGALEEAFEIEIDGGDILPENFNNMEAIIELIVKTQAEG